MSITPQPIIPAYSKCISEGTKIINAEDFRSCTVAYDPIITSGIVRFEGIFEINKYNICLWYYYYCYCYCLFFLSLYIIDIGIA